MILSSIETSLVYSEFATHILKISAPYLLITSKGSTTLPLDLDILLPLPSSTKPCETNALKGDLLRQATEFIKELLNQPRYWSLPSKYKSKGASKPLGLMLIEVDPESNQTSIISFSLLKPNPLNFLGKSSSAVFSYQISEPCFATKSIT